MLSVFKIRKEERVIFLVALLVLVAFNAMVIYKYSPLFLKGGNLGYWSLFSRNFRMSGYDCWSYVMLSNMRVHFETTRHPLFFSFLYPLYLLNQWLMTETGTNCAVFIMMFVIVFCAAYSAVFMFRIFREVVGLSRTDATLLTATFFSFGHVLVTSMVPDHFVISLFLLTMTLYVAGMRLEQHRGINALESALLLVATCGITITNGVKTILACIFTNGRRFFSPRNLLVSVVLPLLLVGGVWYWQYNVVELPQKETIRKMEAKKKSQGKGEELKQWAEARDKWLEEHNGKPISDLPLLNLTNATTSRAETMVDNLFGESIQLHSDYLLEDMSFTRPVFVKYGNVVCYVVEALIVLLFVVGILCGYRLKFMKMCLSWFAFDMLLHLVLGFGIGEIYIMSADWIFIIPISFACMMGVLAKGPLRMARICLFALTLWLWAYNGSLITCYLLR